MHARRKVQDAFREDGLPIEESYERHIVKFLDELESYARALKAARECDQGVSGATARRSS